MSASLSTHVLDAVTGRPAAGVSVVLDRREGDGWQRLASAVTDEDGRVRDLLGGTGSTGSTDGTDGTDGTSLTEGVHRLTFGTGDYFTATGQAGFFPEVPIVFAVRDPDRHHHVPLLLSPYAYSTYRGS